MPSSNTPDNTPEPATSFLHLDDVKSRDKAGWVKAASRSHLKLADWVILTLNTAASQSDASAGKPPQR